MHPVLKVVGLGHIWYYIPLCTISAQQFNGDVLRINFHDSKSKSQNPMTILKEEFSAHQSQNAWQLSEDYSRTPTNWPCRSWVGNSFRIIPRAWHSCSYGSNRAWHSGVKNSLGGLQKIRRIIKIDFLKEE
ncbi:hypothetical protein O181_047621 [Austropuccinia psidii MF-1]|uniref:Uncharacterized protein n=1 Tax=Austropuccinia psidii MF-1 TaxID=1389203 RepID=A0A9Q3DWF1_9BASI|nr:hypothetical protein [Austropuccinia psidii MF-1]